jgi:multidrug efflux pump subunit AcrA (membrane-fusion protein)
MALEPETSEDDDRHGAAHGAQAVSANPPAPGVSAPEGSDSASERAPVEIDSRRQQLIGLRTVAVERTALSRSVRAQGVVRADESRWTDVTLRMEGYVRKLHVDETGRTVRRGQPLVSIYSPDLATALAELRLARSARSRLAEDASGEMRDQADRLVEAARLRLARWEVTPEQMAGSDDSPVEPLIEFRSPAAGIVAEKVVVEGMRVMPGDRLFRLLDLSRVWVEAAVYEADLAFIRPGVRGQVRLDAYPGETFVGRVTFVAPTLDEMTRTAVVRLELANPRGRLKPGMFAAVELDVGIGEGLVVPVDAVVDTGRRQTVFVAEGDGYFQPRGVELGHRVEGRVQVLRGLVEGESVAASATFFLDSESQLRAALQNWEPGPDAVAGSPGWRPTIALSTSPDPPRAGRTDLEVHVTSPEGEAIEDAAVTVSFFMPAMPSMNMPAMKSEAALTSVGGGVYRGSIDVLMNGRWDVSISVARGGERLGRRQLTLLAR